MIPAEYLQRLHELLDGELPAEAEEGLFYALAANAELRAALRQLILVQRTLVREHPSIPAQLEQQLFQRLGFAEQGIRQRWQTGAIAVGSALLGFALGALLFLRTPEPSPSPLPYPSPAVLEMALPMRASAAPSALRAPISVPHTAPHPSPPESPATTVQPVFPREPSMATFTTPRLSPAGLSPSALPESAQPPASPGSSLRVGIRFLGLWQQSSPEVTLPVQSSGVRNLYLSVEQPLSAAHAIALEAGSEDFPQVFSSERTGLQYRQRPTLLWVGLAHHWEPSVEASVVPFLHTLLGGTVVGPLGKAWVGSAIRLGEHSRLRIGLEGTLLLYRFEGQWFSTRKLGISYGMAFSR